MTSLASELASSGRSREEIEAEAARYIDLVTGTINVMIDLKWAPGEIEQLEAALLKLGAPRVTDLE
jgi:hypothetical protein